MPVPSPQSYMLCTSPRSGSTLLCTLLAKTGIAGRPGSHFHDPSLNEWLDDYGLRRTQFASRQDALVAVFAAARQRGTGDSALFGLRMQRGSFDYFMAQLEQLFPGRPNDVARIEAAFGTTTFIYLRRSDKLAQAVSRVMAEQTGLWHRHADGSELERLAPPKPPHYNRQAIARHMADLTRLEAEWETWFAAQNLTPHRISYDELAKAPQGTLATLLEVLGLDPAAARNIEPPTAKLAGAQSREWIERFSAETAG